MSGLLDLNANLSKVDSTVLKLGSNLNEITSGSKNVAQGFSSIAKTLQEQSTFADKAAKSLGSLGSVAGGALKVFSGISEATLKLKAIVDVGNAGFKAWKDFAGITNTVTFATAIQGSDQLGKNLAFLEQTSSTAFGAIEKGIQIFTDGQGFNQWASQAVSSFADVEEAAYRLGTVTVSGQERSIDSISKNIKSMRELQKETGSALDSVTILNAQYDIASGGFTDKKSVKQVGKAAVNLSQAGFGNLGSSTNALVRVQSALGEDSGTAEKRAAQLFQTTKVGLLNLDQLTPNIGALSSQAKQLGVSFEDVTTSLAVLTTQGISADEASTRLTSFLGDVVNVSPEAAKALAQFTDEAGKPIQLNAQILKEKGIQGVIRDLKAATGGELEKIQQIFSNQTSQEFATLLIGAGDKKFTAAKDTISNADTGAFNEEANNRTKTVKGAFSSSFNKSQAEVESFGEAFKSSVLDQLESTNGVLASFSSGSAAALGGLLGKVNAVQTGLAAVGGFVATAFSAVAPIAFGAVIFKTIGSIGKKIKDLEAKEGKSLFEVLKSKAESTGESIKKAFVKAIADIVKEVKKIKDSIEDAGNTTIKLKINKPKDLTTSKPVAKSDTLTKPDSPSIDIGDRESSKVKRKVDSRIKTPVSKPTIPEIEIPKLDTKSKKSFLPEIDTSKLKGSLGQAGKVAGEAAKGGFKLLGSTLLESGKLLGGIGLIGAVASGGISIVSGWASTLAATLDKGSIPAIKEMSEELQGLTGVSGLKESLSEFDSFNGKVAEGNVLLGTYAESLTRLGGLWNIVTGAAAQNNIVQEEISDRQKIIEADLQKAADIQGKGSIDANTPEQQRVKNKLSSGSSLDVDDEQALTGYYDEQIKANQAIVSLQEKKIANEKAQGGGNPEVLEKLEQELKAQKANLETRTKSLNTDKNTKLSANKIDAFKNIDITVPINLQVSSTAEKSVRRQIETLSKSFADTFSGENIDPNKLASLIPELKSALGSIETQIELDPDSAGELRKELEEKLGTNYVKVLASDPGARKKAAEGIEKETVAKQKKATSKEEIANTPLNTAQSLGFENAGLEAAKFENTTKSINSQVEQLSEEMKNPAVGLNRQLEIQQQIEALEAKRASGNADKRIKVELEGRKNLLSINQQLLTLEQAKIGLFSQQNEFDTFSISAANAKLDLAQKQLEVSKSQIAIESREGEIKKEEGIKSLEGKIGRDNKTLDNAIAGGGSSKSNSSLSSKSDVDLSGINKAIDAQTSKQIANVKNTQAKDIQAANQSKQDDLENSSKQTAQNSTYTQNEQATILKGANRPGEEVVKQEDIFTKEGRLKTSIDEIKQKIDKSDSSIAFDPTGLIQANKNVDKSKAREVFSEKDFQQRTTQKRIEKTDPTKDIISKSEEEIKSKQSVANKRKETAKNALEGIKSTEGALASSKKELNFSQVVNDVKARFATLNDVIELSKAKIEAEFAVRDKLIKFSEAIGAATGNIASTVKGLGILGANLGAIGSSLAQKGFEASNPLGGIKNKQDKALTQVDTTVNITKDIFKDSQAALDKGKEKGVSPEIIKQLTANRDKAKLTSDRASEEANIDRARIKEQSALEAANAKLTMFSNRVNTFNEAVKAASENISKIGSAGKDAIDLTQRKNDNKSENAKSGLNVQKSILGFFGSNNPAAQQLGQRLEVKQVDVEAKQQKSQLVTEAKKEVIDLSVQKAQLDLDGKMLENSLTQTGILSDILSVSQGGEATFSTSDEVQKRIKDIPAAIEKSRDLNSVQKGLVDKKLSFIPSELQDKLGRVDADSASKKLGILGGNLQPGNTDLIGGALEDAQKQSVRLNNKNTNFSIGSLGDRDVTDVTSKINKEKQLGIQSAESLSKTSKGADKYGVRDSARKIESLKDKETKADAQIQRDKVFGKDKQALTKDIKDTGAKTAQAQNINNTNNNLTSVTNVYYNGGSSGGNGANTPGTNQQQITSTVNKAVQEALKNMSDTVLRAAKKF